MGAAVLMLPGSPPHTLAESIDTNAAGETVWIVPLTFGRARVTIGHRGDRAYRDGW